MAPARHAQLREATDRATRLLHILISEQAHLIWVLRCERVTREATHSEEMIARWFRSINARLTEDIISATKIKRNEGFVKLMTNTWARKNVSRK
jgi:hypothetical protein